MSTFHLRLAALSAIVLALCQARPLLGAGADTIRINGGDARALLGTGTGVVVGIVDTGVDASQPALAGNVSSGQPRLLAEQNFSGDSSPINPHGTAVASQILSNDPTYTAVATDARYIDAQALNSNGSGTISNIINATGFAVASGANIVNMSLGGSGAGDGNSQLSLMADFIVDHYRVPVVVSAGNSDATPLGQPEDAYNIFSVAATAGPTWNQIADFDNTGPNAGGRNGPNLSAPGSFVDVAQIPSGFASESGTSFAAPNVTGLLTAQIGYGIAHNLSTDPLVLRATAMNSAEKIQDKNGNAWAPAASSTSAGVLTVTSPLDNDSGAGQIDGLQLYNQYSQGQFGPGQVPPEAWDLNSLTTSTVSNTYQLGQLAPGSSLDTTLAWDRHVTDSNNGIINSTDTFTQSQPLSNLDLSVFENGTLIAQSISTVDDAQMLDLSNVSAGDYSIQVSYSFLGGSSEQYALAWSSEEIPEPATFSLLICAGLLALRRPRSISPR